MYWYIAAKTTENPTKTVRNHASILFGVAMRRGCNFKQTFLLGCPNDLQTFSSSDLTHPCVPKRNMDISKKFTKNVKYQHWSLLTANFNIFKTLATIYIFSNLYIYIYIYICKWWLIKIPFSGNGHSSRINCVLSRFFRELHVYL